MALMGVPVRFPDPYPLPAPLLHQLMTEPLDQAMKDVVQLALQAQCADAILLERCDGPMGELTIQEAAAGDPDLGALFGGLTGQPDVSALPVEAFDKDSAMLFMGDLERGGPEVFPAAYRDRWLGGQNSRNIGFFYVFPLVDRSDTARARPLGALLIHRQLESGPLNHDQPAILQALVSLLCDRLVKTPS